MSRLEEIKARQKDAAYLLGGTMIRADWNWLIKQAEERNEWKGKHSILKRKYKSLQRKMNSRWRANRAIMNESKQKHNVLEAFREENQRYKQALNDALSALEYGWQEPNRRACEIINKVLEVEE